MSEYYRQLLDTCESAGIKMLSDDFCCQLLAVVLVFGNEDMIFKDKLREDIRAAQKRLNILGGRAPDTKLARRMSEYVGDLSKAIKTKETFPEWVHKIEKKYDTEFFRESGLIM
jgi:hypothetical protein